MSLFEKVKNKIHNKRIDFGFLPFEKKFGKRIIMYHGIDLLENKQFNGRFIGVKNFEEQIVYFKKNFNIVTLKDYAQGNFKPDMFNIAITFDDGYQNNLKFAVPILEKQKVPASIFITGLNNTESKIIWSDFSDIAAFFLTDNIVLDGITFHKNTNGRLYAADTNLSLYDYIKNDPSGGYERKEKLQEAFLKKIKDFRLESKLDTYWKLMSDEEIKQLASSNYISVGSHGYYHNNLGIINETAAIDEMHLSKKYLENIIQKEVDSIAYPDGSYSPAIVNAAEKLGYSIQLAVNYLDAKHTSNMRLFDRFGVYPFYNANRLGYMLRKLKE
ncbi:MAG TPA: polysaccharide deacetylase family protein [Bacteroidia bacterium]|jgi:peptidoglycan/xylan/chitin deacetylase (PgdA/CDA1 family)|nr:polysaccharide deacetylase family protein [Bacteroidia bacterium]